MPDSKSQSDRPSIHSREHSNSTGSVFAHDALLPDGWASDVRIDLDSSGLIRRIVRNSSAGPEDYVEHTLIPGAINCHSHAFQRLIAGRSETFSSADDDFWSWRTMMYDAVRELTPARLHDVAGDLYREMLAAGTTTVCEFHYVHHLYSGDADASAEAVVSAARNAGIRLLFLPVLYRYGGFGRREPSEMQRPFVHRPTDYLSLVERCRTRFFDRSQVHIGYAPHSLRAVGYEDLSALLDHRVKTDPSAPFHIHVAEQIREVNEAVLALGCRPVSWLYDQFDPDERWCLIHATHTDEEEIKAISGSGTTVGLCPTTEANLGDGVFPLPEFSRASGRFSIGSDSNVTLCAAEELRLLDYQHRLLTRRRNALGLGAVSDEPVRPAEWFYDQALRGGRAACGLPVGRIEAGSMGDFVSLISDHPLTSDRPARDVLASYIYSGGQDLIERVYVGGRPIRA